MSGVVVALAIPVVACTNTAPADQPVIPQLPANPTLSASTVPASGDLNPYGVAFVPRGFPEGGLIGPGDILVSNFNDGANVQGTGSTIVAIHPDGQQSVFFQGPAGLGLSTALGVLQHGFVIVGNVPSTNGSGMCTEGEGGETGVGQGALKILDRYGSVVRILTSEELLNGPWDLTVLDLGDGALVFVSNVLSGTVSRLALDLRGGGDEEVRVEDAIQIASGYLHRCDPDAFVVGPTGLALDVRRKILYVASTGDNAIFAIQDAITRSDDAGMGTVFIDDPAHLHGPLGLARAPNGNLLSAQGDAVNPDPDQVSQIVEYDREGRFIAKFGVATDPGAAFGIAIQRSGDGFSFAAVNDAANTLDVWDVH